jgi:hypothetical protein
VLRRGSSRTSVGVILGVWIVMAALVNPVGNFPMNDDWAYGWSVKTLLDTGDFRLSDWTAVNLLPQVIWGALLCTLTGFSFTTLRVSTLMLGAVGVLTTYALLREVRADRSVALVGALAVAVNPLYFSLASSFMSDVPSFTLTVASIYFLVRALRRGSDRDLAVGVVIACLSILNRQSGLIVLPAFGVAYLITDRRQSRDFWRAIVPSIVGGVVYFGYAHWLAVSGRAPHLYNLQTRMVFESLAGGVRDVVANYAANAFAVSTYVGLFSFPFLLMSVVGAPRRARLAQLGAAGWVAVVAVAIVGAWAARYQRLPLVGNVLDVAGIGPSWTSGLLPDTGRWPVVVRRTWQVLTVLGVAGAALLWLSFITAARQVGSRTTDEATRRVETFMIASVAMLFLPIGALPKWFWFDRYLVPFLPLLMVLVIESKPADPTERPVPVRQAAVAVVLLLLSAVFTVAGTHDYLAWSRARWRAANTAMEEAVVGPERVNGGRQFRGWYLGNRLATCNPAYTPTEQTAAAAWHDFTCLSASDNAAYTLARTADADARVEKRYSYRRWLPPGAETLYLVRLNGAR